MTAKNFTSQQPEHAMIPLLAAASTIDTVDKFATGAMALWKQLSAKKADAKDAGGSSAGSFNDVLASQSNMGAGGLVRGASSLDTDLSHAKAGKTAHAVNQLA